MSVTTPEMPASPTSSALTTSPTTNHDDHDYPYKTVLDYNGYNEV
jgi:hypothetical protein